MKYDIGKLNVQVGAVTLQQNNKAALLICLRGGGFELVPLDTEANLHRIVQHLKYAMDKIERVFHVESLIGDSPKVVEINPHDTWESLRPALIQIQG